MMVYLLFNLLKAFIFPGAKITNYRSVTPTAKYSDCQTVFEALLPVVKTNGKDMESCKTALSLLLVKESASVS